MLPVRSPRLLHCILISTAAFSVAHASEPAVTVPANLVLERFEITRGNEAVLLPVKIGTSDHLFMVDTGSTYTIFDTSLPLGPPRGRMTLKTPLGSVEASIHATPDSTIGSLPLNCYVLISPLSQIYGMDLESWREASGLPIEGVLGMDFLGRCIVHVDFDRGELLFLHSMPKTTCAAIPILWEFGSIPEVEAEVDEADVSDGHFVRFRIDTGWLTDSSGTLESNYTKKLVDLSNSQVDDTQPILGIYTMSGSSPIRLCQGKRLSLGEFVVNRPTFVETGRNLLGLGFWSRFVVTFDFPGHRLYLNKGELYGRQDRRNLLNLRVRPQ